MTGVNAASATDIATLLGAALRRAVAELAELSSRAHPELRASHARIVALMPAGGERITDLAERAGMTKQGLGQLVDHLQQHGYVESVPSPSDGRVRIVRRTPRGDSARDDVLAAVAQVERQWSAELGERRYAALREALVAVARR